MIAGPSGASAKLPLQAIGAPAVSSASYWIWASGGLVSISVTSSAARNSGTTRAARKASLISVPRPGPSSITRTGLGRPIDVHTSAAHRPMSSPNICEISGAVVKSPSVPNGSRVM